MVNIDQETTLRHARKVMRGGAPDALLNSMMAMLKSRNGHLEAREEKKFVPLIVEMAERTEMIFRQKLSNQVAELAHAPLGLLEFIAYDEIDVAGPLLKHSSAMDDNLLLDVIAYNGAGHAAAIAERPGLSNEVSAAIVDTKAVSAIAPLLRNGSAEIDDATFREISDCAKNCPALQKEMVSREDLPTVIAQQLFWHVKNDLRRQILDKFPIQPDQLDEVLGEAVVAGLADPDVMQFRKLIHKSMRINGMALHIPVNDTINHIKAGRVAQFAKGVSGSLTVRKTTIQKIMADAGGEALAVLCRALDADRVQFTSALLTNDYRRCGMPRALGQIEKVSNIYDSITPDEALATVQMWDALEDQQAA